ncbi:tyrosine-protein phosphatase non-receptor type 5-like [Pollicipes pollicipes]|uniref:tyrosine-protein phosphatase non-receptor type 5-like n=1 Tax=Pollicipes pollicipes TaxID=41117 RepID=UPI001884D590|nr:tyrosine-protein phosphatase non-receptor type 5-like [Pollicipes pollicipes]
MPWLLVAAIAVGTVATVLAAVFVAHRVRGGPGKVVTQQWIPHHVLRMSTGSADIQPPGGRAGDGTSEPIRIKAKGLLERRCSSSSLTIQLQQAEEDGEPIVIGSPARQCEAAEYLASAGNRLSRRELRLTEENVAALQAEFWDIPLNFPDKCDIVGASTKNRYKTVMPNEHTRVTLPGVNEDPLSSYINANWIRAKGLLERRCSSSSLTIQLQQAEEDGEPIVIGSPARQCEAAEYLASAGNRLSRRELRLTEENVAALQAEFWDIPLNFPDKCDIVGASTKNRYKTVMPNEHTRVTLPGVNEDPLSSYINANWIRGYDNEERAYIATQGPLAHTLEDFWQMVLSRRAPAVVMITKLRENGRIKCAGYLPETRQKATFGKIEVTVKRILPRNGYTLRHISVKRGKEQLQLQHFWFTAWPDHRTPEDSEQLLQMAAEVEAARRDSEGNPTGPVVVHCSAGIGRTGCFIAISIGTSQLMEEGGVDVLGIVCGMRQGRGGMVQTAEQYIFIHRALRDFEACLPPLDASDRRIN